MKMSNYIFIFCNLCFYGGYIIYKKFNNLSNSFLLNTDVFNSFIKVEKYYQRNIGFSRGYTMRHDTRLRNH